MGVFEKITTTEIRRNHCPRCGRFLRLSVGCDNGYCVLIGFCSKERIVVILDEFHR